MTAQIGAIFVIVESRHVSEEGRNLWSSSWFAPKPVLKKLG
jgi:hypothetical protein